MDPKNAVVLVTGCSSGIGRALVTDLAARGCIVYASARRLESIADLQGGNVRTVRLDVCDKDSMQAAVDQIIADEGRIDVLVNNAGYGQMGPLIDLTEEQLRRQLDTNVVGQVTLIQLVAKHMIPRKSGCIANVGSVSGVMATPFAGAYCASKAALNVLSDTLRMELLPFGVDVIIVAPGAVRSKFGDNAEEQVDIRDDSVYQPVREGVSRRAQASQSNTEPADKVAKDIGDALFASPRPTWVATGAGAIKYLMLKRLLPSRRLDKILMGAFGLDKLNA
ncbi:MAG: SDR family NAD(P)-dependent oxidoreductase [Candidatus Hydrogenedens sp.]|nr:SDR family NAD(P)-dependent oxidoreductase [Candidatus Hydrogenedens sp.]